MERVTVAEGHDVGFRSHFEKVYLIFDDEHKFYHIQARHHQQWYLYY